MRQNSDTQRTETDFEQFKHIVPNIQVRETRIEHFKLHVMDIFSYQARNLGRGVANNIQQRNNVGATREILEYLDFALYLFLLHGFQHLDDAFLLGDDVDALENLLRG